jgi:coenzyme F420 biosynthesis associated uncharacterized protein
MGSMVDWSLASTISRGVAKLAPAGDPAPFQAVEGPNAESERLVSAYTGLQPISPLPAPEAVGREEWIDANLSSMRGVLDPVAGKLAGAGGGGLLGGIVGNAAGGLLAIEAGAISGFLAGRVLGQYEFPVLDPEAPSRLLFLAPNLGHVAVQLEADPEQLLRWVSLHETTHALQFGGVPWLRGHIAASVGGLLDSLTVDPKGLLRMPDTSDLRALVDNVREGGVASVVLGEEQRAQFDTLQALMAVLEGYAEHVMDAVGADVLEDLPALRASLDRRRRERSGFMRLLERLIGMDLKLRQYELGKRFCDGVAARGGIETLNRVWISPAAMPTLAELEDPAAWIARTEHPELGRAA